MRFTSIPPWKQSPFIRIVIPFALGIAATLIFPLTFMGALAPAIGTSLGILALSILSTSNRYRVRLVIGLLCNTHLFFCGMVVNNSWKQDRSFDSSDTKSQVYIIVIKEAPVRKTNTYRALGSCTQVSVPGRNAHHQTVLIYFDTGSVHSKLVYGSMIVMQKELQPIKGSSNPGSFDFKNYNARKGIFMQVYLREQDYYILSSSRKEVFVSLLLSVREWCINTLKKYIRGSREAGLAEALLIGYKQDLDSELLRSYTNTGVVHIIAISGLHLGLIYVILKKTCEIFRIRRRVPRAIIILVSLWIFSFLVGGGPSVFRSAVMFSFIVLGDSASRKIPILNSLAASAFFLLCIYPNYLFDAGFQLSYSAVLSLVLFVRPITNSIICTNPGLYYLWKLVAVTIAAQILTLPFTLNYFHQFPIMFLITNVVGVPVSSIVLLLLILLCIISPIPYAPVIVGKITSWLIYLLNSIIGHVEKIPYSTWAGLNISLVQSVFIFLIIAFIGQWFASGKKIWLGLSLGSVFIFSSIRAFDFFTCSRQQTVIVYSARGHQVIQAINGRKSIIIADTMNASIWDYVIKTSIDKFRISDYALLAPQHCNKLIEFGDHRIVVIEKGFPKVLAEISIGCVVLSRNARVKLDSLNRIYPHLKSRWIIDESNQISRVRNWQKKPGMDISPHYTGERGAFVLKLN